ncbi:hypothetical protein Back11_24900 [Paenibacillus baekrokdamisoli]|uniref:Uncharacterized protein n=1 Tax=Paenibacillus baekrokdamisoli TaxID=1712516 RepID=A0A3G9IYC6_9BACL|nr:DNA-binding NarL/FixJ family response regulator [Paenibacillus baekrokdamisoli]BBH21145.1 hypothetical protein Back11_24900 [Paenibacillus baekrokdamisoli]
MSLLLNGMRHLLILVPASVTILTEQVDSQGLFMFYILLALLFLRAGQMTALGLTQVEQQVVDLIAKGKSNKEIASLLYLSEGTIKNYISVILGKLELRDRTQIAIFYLTI